MTKKLYIPIRVENLAFYLSSACFAPANFFEQRGRDVQSMCDGSVILLSEKQLVGESDCSVEICLTETELKPQFLLKISEDCYEYSGILPLSRLVCVYFSSSEQLEHMVTEINLNTAFLSVGLCNAGNLSRSEYEPKRHADSARANKLYESYIKYQRLLGGTALMRVVNDFPYTYSRNYLPLIAEKNSYIKSIMDAADVEADGLAFLGKADWYTKIQQLESNKDERAQNYPEAIKEYADKQGEEVSVNPSKHTYDLNKLSGGALVLAYLFNYRLDDLDAGGRIGIDGQICDRFAGVKSAEDVAFFFGYSRGYARFTKSYENVNVKFDLDSWLDMYVVETIFQRSLSMNNIGRFSYIDERFEPCAKKSKLAEGEFLLLDQYVICKKKASVGSDEWFEGFFQRSAAKVEGVLKALGEYIAPKLLDDATKWIRREMRDIMRPLILDALSEKDKEMRRKLAEAEQNYALQLKEVNRDLFDEIDTNHDGILSYEEIHAFLDRLATTYNRVKHISVNVEQHQNRDSIVDNGLAGTSKSDSSVSQVSESLPSNKKRSTTRTPRQTSKKRSEPQLF